MTSPSNDALPETAHFGLTRIGAGEAQSKNGWSFSDLDRLKLDDLLYAALTHTHTGQPALGNPTDPPALASVSTGGLLPAGTQLFYRASFVDQFGLETAASPEASITTAPPLAPPSAPGAIVDTTAGTVQPGVYSYLLTYTDSYGGETTPSAFNNVQVIAGATPGPARIILNLPPLGLAAGIKVYRARPGQSALYYVGSSTGSTFTDAGVVEDQTITAPTLNTTNGNGSVVVTIPLNFIPLGCVAWKIYRAFSSGGYDGNSLVHEVIETVSATSTVPVTTWTDTGDVLLAGFPQNSSSTVPAGSLLSLNDLQGVLPISVIPRGVQCLSAFGNGPISNGRVITVTESPVGVQPARLTAFFGTPPSTGMTVRVRVTDTAATPSYVELSCPAVPATPVSPVGYYHMEFPLIGSKLVYASTGTRTGTAVLVTDVTATNQEAVQLVTTGDAVQVDLGTLDTGSYTAFVNLRPIAAGSFAGDVRVQVLNMAPATPTVLATGVFTVDTVGNGFRDVSLAFTPPGGADIAVSVSRVTSAAQSYNVQSVRFTAGIPSLAAGELIIEAFVDSPATPGALAADVNVALWF